MFNTTPTSDSSSAQDSVPARGQIPPVVVRPRITGPAGGTSEVAVPDRQITPLGLFYAFRRRWIPTIVIAVPLTLLVGLLLWETIPGEFESFATLQVFEQKQNIVFKTSDGESEFLTYRDTQMNSLSSRPVLLAALRRPGVLQTKTLQDAEHPLEYLEEELLVESDVSPEFIKVLLKGQEPGDLKLIVDAIKDAYLDEVVLSERSHRVSQLRELERSYEEVNEKYRHQQDRIDKLAEALGSGKSEALLLRRQLAQNDIQALQRDLQNVKTQVRAEEATQQYLRQRGLSPNTPLIGINATADTLNPNSPLNPGSSASLQQQLIELQLQISQFESHVANGNHPDLVPLRQRRDALLEMLKAMRQSIEPGDKIAGVPASRLDWLQRQQEDLDKEIADKRLELEAVDEQSIELERQQKEIAHLAKTRDRLAEEVSQRTIELNAPDRIRVVHDATMPQVRSNKARIRFAGLACALVFGSVLGGFTLFEWFAHRIVGPDTITNELGMRMVGSIPAPDQAGLAGLGLFTGKRHLEDWNRAVVESVDVIRTYLLRHLDSSRSASVLVTSASANEGKTTVSCQLAASLARTGRRTVVVDCDFRRPSAHETMQCAPGPGICELLRSEAKLDSIVQSTGSADLFFIPAGVVDQAALRCLATDGGRALIGLLKQHFEVVILDTSPLLFVAEPSMMAQNADVSLLIVRREFSRVPFVRQATQTLRNLQVPLLGTVLVAADSSVQRQSYGYQQHSPRRG